MQRQAFSQHPSFHIQSRFNKHPIKKSTQSTLPTQCFSNPQPTNHPNHPLLQDLAYPSPTPPIILPMNFYMKQPTLGLTINSVMQTREGQLQNEKGVRNFTTIIL
jgi:hypothetical protein